MDTSFSFPLKINYEITVMYLFYGLGIGYAYEYGYVILGKIFSIVFKIRYIQYAIVLLPATKHVIKHLSYAETYWPGLLSV